MIIKGLPKFSTEKELFDFLVQHEDTIFSQAKTQIKEADSIGAAPILLKQDFSNKTQKEVGEELLLKDQINVKTVINTTGILDSHDDVHIPKLWDKSLQENKRMLHVQEHKSREFDKIISSGEDLKAYTKNFDWKELGYNFEGKTQALMFDSNVKKERNEYMFNQYAKGYVDNHSVGMYYVKLQTCINHEDYPVQKENFDKYEQYIVNRKALDGRKVFWAVTEAKAIEGSAVPMGSNPFTPTTSTKTHKQYNSRDAEKQALIDWMKKL